MTCEEAREAFSDLYDGTLSGPPLTELHHHLDTCPACREEWASFRAGLQALRKLGGAEPDPGFAGRVVARIEAPSAWQRLAGILFVPFRGRVPLHAAALAVLVLAGVWLLQREPTIQKAAEIRPPAPAPRVAVPPAPREAAAPAPPSPLPPPARKTAPTLKGPVASKSEPTPPAGVTPAMPAPPTPVPAAPAPTGEGQGKGAMQADRAVEPKREVAAPMAAVPSRAIESWARQAEPSAEEARSPVPDVVSPPQAASRLGASSAPKAKEAERVQVGGPSADDLFSAAATAYANGQFEAAVRGFGAFLARHGTDRRAADARFFLASAHLRANHFGEASAEYETFLRQHPDHRRAPAALYRQAEARLGAGDPAACELLRSALQRHPEERDAAGARRLLGERCR